MPVLAESHRVYAIDLIGYGYSDKPNPRNLQVEHFYTFETWASQLNDFCMEVVKDEAFFVCNSIGGNYFLISLRNIILLQNFATECSEYQILTLFSNKETKILCMLDYVISISP